MKLFNFFKPKTPLVETPTVPSVKPPSSIERYEALVDKVKSEGEVFDEFFLYHAGEDRWLIYMGPEEKLLLTRNPHKPHYINKAGFRMDTYEILTAGNVTSFLK